MFCKKISKKVLMLCTAAALLVTTGCGKFEVAKLNSHTSSSTSFPPVPGLLSTKTKFTCDSPATRGIGQKNFRRLSKIELVTTIEDFFGTAIRDTPQVSSALDLIPNESPGDIVKEFVNAHSFNQVASFLSVGEAIANQVFASPATRASILGACASQEPIAESCVRQFLTGPGARLLRRVPSSARVDELVGIFKDLGGSVEGFKGLLMVLLQTPEFLFHLELGRANSVVDNGRLQLNDFEVASRISYAITGTLPDAALFSAANQGALKTVSQVRGQVERLINTPRARQQFERIIDAWLVTASIQEPNGVLASRQGIEPSGLKAEARQELLDYATYMVFDKNADLPNLLYQQIGFPRSARMAKIYGSELSTGQPVPLPQGHGGLLLRASTLMTSSLASSPIMRGVTVRKRLLCDILPSPDFSIITQRSKDLAGIDTTKLSNREGVALITNSATCMGCHSQINPIGFSLEKFDPLGMSRKIETVFNSDGSVKATHPIDLNVSNPNLEPGGPTSLSSSDDLMKAISLGYKSRACIAERLFSHARLRALVPEDSCAASEVEKSILSGGSVKNAWIQSVANEDILWRKDSP